MKKIWYFGDSNTETYNPNYLWASRYIEWKGYTPKHWTELFAERMELPYSNLGLGGCDNYTIFKTLSDTIEMINDDDIVIIGWTIPIRGRIANLDSNKWFTIVPQSNPNLKCIKINTFVVILSVTAKKFCLFGTRSESRHQASRRRTSLRRQRPPRRRRQTS